MEEKNGLVVDEDGNKYWYKDGKLHREDGPAIEKINGTKWWYIKGKCHRENGPAFEGANGDKKRYIDDKIKSEKDFLLWQLENNKHPLQELHKSKANKKLKV